MSTGTIFQDRRIAALEGSSFKNYFLSMWNLLSCLEVTEINGNAVNMEQAKSDIATMLLSAHAQGNKVFFVGNGGSAAIASHMAADFCKNGGIRAMALNDASALTCLSNDLGYEHVFSEQISMHACKDDVLVAISSSGRSENILNAVRAAAEDGCMIVTLSGFDRDNTLRKNGDWNFYVPSHRYGLVETAHLAICHAMLDFVCEIRIAHA